MDQGIVLIGPENFSGNARHAKQSFKAYHQKDIRRYQLSPNLKKSLAVTIILLILIISFSIRLTSITRYASFDLGDYPPDASQGALALMEMKTAFMDKFVYGKEHVAGWQFFLGAKASQGNFSVPPLCSWMIFPMTFLGADPVLFVVPFALFSWLTTLLLMMLVHRLLDNIAPTKRLLLAGLAGLWQAIFFTDIFFTSYSWSPGVIPFFFILFILLYKAELDAAASMPVQISYWALYGIILAILVSLHTTTLLIMPAVFLISCVFFIFKNYRDPGKRLLPLISIATLSLALLPYLYLENSRGWFNTKEIIKTMMKSSSGAVHVNPFLTVLSNYAGLTRDAYFLDSGFLVTMIAFVFLTIVSMLGVFKFRGNKRLFSSIVVTFLVYCFAVSHYTGPDHIHNKSLILFVPMIFTISTLAYADFSKLRGKILCGFLMAGIALSLWNNIRYDYKHFYYRYSGERLMTSGDMIDLLSRIPDGAAVCTPGYTYWSRREYHPFKYIDKYIVKKNFTLKNFEPGKTEDCQPGDYIVYPKYKFEFVSFSPFKPEFRVLKAGEIDPHKLHLVYESASAYLFVK